MVSTQGSTINAVGQFSTHALKALAQNFTHVSYAVNHHSQTCNKHLGCDTYIYEEAIIE